jgi:hypothetical protein
MYSYGLNTLTTGSLISSKMPLLTTEIAPFPNTPVSFSGTASPPQQHMHGSGS